MCSTEIERKCNWFFDHICTSDWNENQDAGYPMAQATEDKVALFPEYEKEIRMFYGRWVEMLGDSITGTVDILKKCIDSEEYKVYSLNKLERRNLSYCFRAF